jgi:hypothetical protein
LVSGLASVSNLARRLRLPKLFKIHQLIYFCNISSMNESSLKQSGSAGSATIVQLLEPEKTDPSSNKLSLADISWAYDDKKVNNTAFKRTKYPKETKIRHVNFN